uniref:Beta-carboxy-cis,cis-muconate cycloisomerase n=1 Tax=Terrabacter sp. (strain DBF63) TaxID=150395 RepID=Q3MNP2_TERSD|nr:beta-carboxy-cis,cis-muconate cycloisomerase [Terrabacter sp. DBF63]
MTGYSLLTPGSHRSAGALEDAALVGAMLQVEVAWLRALARVGAVDSDLAGQVAKVTQDWEVDMAALAAESEAAGNAVVPLVRLFQEAVGQDAARVVHRGLTSQDVVDTALVLLARDALVRMGDDLAATSRALAALAGRHRSTLMVGRTLTQHAVPITFGLKAAQWLAGVLDAVAQVDDILGTLPVQCGGAAGTLALVGELTDEPLAAARAFADELALDWPGVPWHTNRSVITRIGSAVVSTCDALGVVAADVSTLSRPEIGELREGTVAGRGGSSTMPHKRNPVLSVLIRSVALQAPLLGAQLHLAAAQAVDERPDGAWHSEWPALVRLLEAGVTSASQAAELTAGLEVDGKRMGDRVAAAADELLSERGGGGKPVDYLGSTDAFIDTVLARVPEGRAAHG